MSAQQPRSQAGPALPVVGDLINNRYCVLDELGRGGMGVVLAVHDTWLQRDVAIKVLLPRWAHLREAVLRFTGEARNLARLDSPHVVRVMNYGSMRTPAKSIGLPYMVLELLQGEDLYSVGQHGRLEPQRVVRYALEACSGLAAAHALGIVHRDLKPENLFVAVAADGHECLKVLDFGIARSRRRAATRGRAGSPGYMSPEQVSGTTVLGAQTDIWALGVVMYELLTHRAAFEGDTPEALCVQTLTAPVFPLRELRPDLPNELIAVVERCLERSPERRFADVAELAAALAPLDPTRGAANTAATTDPEPCELVEKPARRAPRCRILARSLATAIFVPALVVLPCAAAAPEATLARSWCGGILGLVGSFPVPSGSWTSCFAAMLAATLLAWLLLLKRKDAGVTPERSN